MDEFELYKEYKARVEEVTEWYDNAVAKNLPNLLKAIGQGYFEVPITIENGFGSDREHGGNILQIYDLSVDSSCSWNSRVRSIWKGTSAIFMKIR
jgi:hypothetical protein